MAIGRIVWLYPRLTTWMGGSRFVIEVLYQLKQRHEVLLIVQREDRSITDELRNNGVEVLCLDTPSYTEIQFWIFFNRTIKRTEMLLQQIVQPDDVLISSMFPMNVLAARFNHPHAQIIYEPFSLFFDTKFQKSHSVPIHIFLKMISAIFSRKDIDAVNSADVFMTLSDYERRHCLNVYGKDSFIIYEGVDTEYFKPSPIPGILEKYNGLNIVFHSTGYDSYKGTDLLIKAIPKVIRQCPDTHFLISHTRENKGKLKGYMKYLSDYDVLDSVEFPGFLDYKLLPAYYTLSDIYVEPGLGRSMSLSSKEANACGTPSIRGEVGTEDIIDGVTGILTSSYDEAQLAENIIMLLENGPLRAELGENARKHVLEQYTWPAVAKRIESNIGSGERDDSTN